MSNVNSMIETVSSVFTTTESTVAGMPDKSRIQLKELAQTVASATGIEPKDALVFVTYFARNTDLGYVSRGKNGGLIRGSRPLKNLNMKQEKSLESDEAEDSSNNSDEE